MNTLYNPDQESLYFISLVLVYGCAQRISIWIIVLNGSAPKSFFTLEFMFKKTI